jgi:hypothetical protein
MQRGSLAECAYQYWSLCVLLEDWPPAADRVMTRLITTAPEIMRPRVEELARRHWMLSYPDGVTL